jgi:hypothetical protein
MLDKTQQRLMSGIGEKRDLGACKGEDTKFMDVLF